MLMLFRIFLVLLTAIIAPSANAYECWVNTPLYKQIRDADATFIGKIIDIKPMPADYKELNTARLNITFSVYEDWKTNTQKTITADVEEFYEYDFQEGDLYFVQAFSLYPERLTIVGCPRAEEITQENYPHIRSALPTPYILQAVHDEFEPKKNKKEAISDL